MLDLALQYRYTLTFIYYLNTDNGVLMFVHIVISFIDITPQTKDPFLPCTYIFKTLSLQSI